MTKMELFARRAFVLIVTVKLLGVDLTYDDCCMRALMPAMSIGAALPAALCMRSGAMVTAPEHPMKISGLSCGTRPLSITNSSTTNVSAGTCTAIVTLNVPVLCSQTASGVLKFDTFPKIVIDTPSAVSDPVSPVTYKIDPTGRAALPTPTSILKRLLNSAPGVDCEIEATSKSAIKSAALLPSPVFISEGQMRTRPRHATLTRGASWPL
mmetsp:Transcript_22604/g.33152  ORF Transcript_22604/g.33152 Transcript_22604/m.33152 type:complete len:210 (-) Transcript_22604:564-1193(-)